MVPPGIHVISYAAADSQGGLGPTTAFFLYARGGQILAWRWSPLEEILLPILDTTSDFPPIEHAVKSFQLDQNLAPYNLAAYTIWRDLVGSVSQKTLDTVAPIGGNINILAEANDSLLGIGGSSKPTAAEIALEEALAKGRRKNTRAGGDGDNDGEGGGGKDGREAEEELKTTISTSINKEETKNQDNNNAAPHAGRCYFTRFPRIIKKPNLTAAQLTAANLDKSLLLEEILQTKYNNSEDEFLGEFQYAFVAFLLGHSLEGFSQWKEFLRLMMSCEAAAVSSEGEEGQNKNRSMLFTRFLLALHSQLLHTLAPGCTAEEQAAPLGIPMVEELLADSFLRKLCTSWLRWISEEHGVPQPLSEAASAVSTLLHKTLGWNCGPVQDLFGSDGGEGEESDDEDGPVIVEGVELLL
jgi:A1 cistron-splicing factor AAR2